MSEDTQSDPEQEQESSKKSTTEAPNWARARKELDRLIGWSLDLAGMLFIFFVLGFMSEGCTITTSTHEYSVGIFGKSGPHMTARPLNEKTEKIEKQQGSNQEAKTTP